MHPANLGLCAQGEANLEEVIPWALGRNQNWLAGTVFLTIKMGRVEVMCCTVRQIMIIRWQLQGQ